MKYRSITALILTFVSFLQFENDLSLIDSILSKKTIVLRLEQLTNAESETVCIVFGKNTVSTAELTNEFCSTLVTGKPSIFSGMTTFFDVPLYPDIHTSPLLFPYSKSEAGFSLSQMQ